MTPVSFGLDGINFCLWETFHQYIEKPSDELVNEFDKLIYLHRLYMEAHLAGFEEFSWQKAYDLGWFSKHTLNVFAKELESVDKSTRKY